MTTTKQILGNRCIWYESNLNGSVKNDLCARCDGYKITARRLECDKYIELPNHNPRQDSHLKGADYTRVEVRRENSQSKDGFNSPQNQPSIKNGVHALDVRELDSYYQIIKEERL